MSTFIPNKTNNHQQPMMQNLKPHAQAHLLSPTEKCKICDQPAARHVHYGATTCFSCRAFFRRSLQPTTTQHNTAAKYKCMRQSMCEMNIKTRKNCQYCRYMKCLAVGMNPNYVLSEDERKRRFRKKNSSVKEKEQATIAPAAPVVKSVGNSESKKMRDEPEMLLTVKKTQTLTEQAETYRTSQAISSQTIHRGSDTEKKCIKNSSPRNEQYFCPNIQATQQRAANQNRDSIIIKNSAPFLKTNFLSNNRYLDTEYKNSVQNEDNTLNNRNIFLNAALFQYHPTMYPNPHSKVIKENNCSCNKGFLFKELHEDQESEIATSSESEDEIIQRIMLNKEPEIIFTDDEKHQLDKLVFDHDTVYHSVNFGEVLIKEMLMCSMFGVAMSTSAAIQGYRLQVERITRTANSLNCFTNLQKADQVTLLKENADLLVSLRGAMFFDKKKKGVDQVMSSMGVEDMETIKILFKPLIQTHKMNHIDYLVFNSIQDPATKKTEEWYSYLQGKVADSILDNIATILMTYIILFSSDFCSLDDRRLVERTQHHYLRILERCLYGASSRMRACSKMASLLNAVTCVREMADIKKCRTINHSATTQCQVTT